MIAFSPPGIDRQALEELKMRQQLLAQKAGIFVGSDGGTAKPAPTAAAMSSDTPTAAPAPTPAASMVQRNGFGNDPSISGIPVGGERETLSQWAKRQGGGNPFTGQSAGSDRLAGSNGPTDATPAPTPQRPAAGGGLLSRLGSGLNDAGNNIGSSLGGDFGSRLGDMMAGWGAGRNVNESLAYGAQMALSGRKERREDAKTEAENNKTAAWLVAQGILTADQAANASPAMLSAALDIYKTKATREPKGPSSVAQGTALVTDDGKEIYKNPAAPEKPNIVTLVGPDGKTSKSLDIGTDGGRKAAQALLQAGWTERQSAGVNVNVGDKITEFQSKDLGYYARGAAAHQEFSPIEQQLTSFAGAAADKLPALVGNYMKSSEYQQAERGGKEFVAMLLRKDSGAAVTPQEWDYYKNIYVPVPGDTPDVIASKKQAREQAMSALRLGLGPAASYADKIDENLAARAAANQKNAAPMQNGGQPMTRRTKTGVEYQVEP